MEIIKEISDQLLKISHDNECKKVIESMVKGMEKVVEENKEIKERLLDVENDGKL